MHFGMVYACLAGVEEKLYLGYVLSLPAHPEPTYNESYFSCPPRMQGLAEQIAGLGQNSGKALAQPGQLPLNL